VRIACVCPQRRIGRCPTLSVFSSDPSGCENARCAAYLDVRSADAGPNATVRIQDSVGMGVSLPGQSEHEAIPQASYMRMRDVI